MTQEAKALLDELMGRTRNLDPTQSHQDITWESDEVCKYFLCGFCPNELFTNTRADLGPCNKIHDDMFRKQYQENPRFERCGYEEDFIRFLQTLITDVEKRIRRGHQRLALNSQSGSVNGNPTNQNEDKIKLLTEKINELVEQAESLGCEGKVEEAQGMMKLADQLKEERTTMEKQPVGEDAPMIKQMEVCDVCGAFLIVGDAPQRQDEHLMGKQHAGYAQVRAELDKRKKKARDEMDAREENELKLKQEREDREKERLREREDRMKRDDRRDRDDRRQRDRDRTRERQKERERRRRSRSRSKDRRSRRRSSSRDRKSRRSRSRSRDRRRRSGSRSRRSRRSTSRDRKSSRRSSRDRSSRSRNRTRSRDRRDRDSKESRKIVSDRSDRHRSKERQTSEDKEKGSLRDGSREKSVDEKQPSPNLEDKASVAVDQVEDAKGSLKSEGDSRIDD